MLFADDNTSQSLDYHFGEAGSFGACNLCNNSNHAIDVDCSDRDDFGWHNFGVANFNRHCIDFGGPHYESVVAWSNNIMHKFGVTADAGRQDFSVVYFDRHIDFGGPHHESSVAWSNNITHEAGITADAGINSNTNNMLEDLETVVSLFSIGHSIDSNKPLPSNTYNSPATMNIPVKSKATIVSMKEDEASFLHGQALRTPLSRLDPNIHQSKLCYCPVLHILFSIETRPFSLLFSR
jgi:hypothetical protein